MPGNGVYDPSIGLNTMDMPGTGWTDLDQLLGYSGNVDFPYFPGEVQNIPAYAPQADTAASQWNDLFGNLSNSNTWGPMTNGVPSNPNMGMMGQNTDWTTGLPVGNDQAQAEDRVNDFFQHVASALGG